MNRWAYRVKRRAGYWAEVGTSRIGAFVSISVGNSGGRFGRVQIGTEEARALRKALSRAIREMEQVAQDEAAETAAQLADRRVVA